MENAARRYGELIERRLGALRLLETELRECQEALVKMDLERILQHLAHQEIFLSEIGFLEQQMAPLEQQLPRGLPPGQQSLVERLALCLDPATTARLQGLVRETGEVRAQVQRLNRVLSALLRRSRRSINVLMNVLANCSATYQPHAFPRPVTSSALMEA